jgi:hypothetical protein
MQSSSSRKLVRVKKPKPIPKEPPKIVGQFFQRVVLRFVKTSAATAVVNWRCLSNLLIASTSTTAGYVIYTTFRPKSFTLYVPALVNTSATGFLQVPADLDMVGGRFTGETGVASPVIVEREYASLTATSGKGGSIRVKFPRPYSTYDVYAVVSQTNTPTIVSVNGPIGSVVDFDCVYKIFGDDRTSFSKTSSTTGATAQVPYFNYLDASSVTGAAGTQILKPISVDPALVNSAAWL